MSKNCLYKKLKSVVDNSTLCKFGENYYENNGNSNITVRFETNGATPVNARVIRGTITCNVYGSVSTLNVGDNSVNDSGLFILTLNPGSALFLNNKYLHNITMIKEQNVNGNVLDLSYMDGYTRFTTSRTGDVSFLKTKGLIYVEFANSVTNIEEGFSGSKTTLVTVYSYSENIVNNITYWCDFTAITSFGGWGCENLLKGQLEDLINGWIDKGRTSGTLSLGYPSTLHNLTYDNGNGRKSISELYPQDGAISVTWDAQGNITIN